MAPKFRKSKIKKNYKEQSAPSLAEVSFTDAYQTLFTGSEKELLQYNPSAIVTRRGMHIFDRMRIDSQIKSAMSFKKNTVLASGWDVKDPEGQEDWEVTRFVRDSLRNMKGTLERKLMQMMTSLDYGYSVTEKIWSQKNDKIILETLKTRKPHDFYFKTDTHGNLSGMDQLDKAMPVDKFIVYTNDMEFDNWYGTSELEAAYTSWWGKFNAYKWLSMLLEKRGIPPIFALYDPDSYTGSKSDDIYTILDQLQAATSGVIPRGDKDDLEFWTPELSKSAGDTFIPSIDMYDSHIAKALLMPGMLGFTPDEGGGSQARAQVHFDVFLLNIERIRMDISESIMNEVIIKELVDYNFNVDEYPTFEFLPITSDLRLEVLSVWNDLTGSQVVISDKEDERHIRELIDFPERDMSKDEQREKEEKEKKEADVKAEDEEEKQFSYARKKNKRENNSNIKEIAAKMGEIESLTIKELENNFAVTKRALLSFLGKNFKTIKPDDVRLKGMAGIQATIQESLRLSFASGRDSIKDEFKKYDAGPGYILSSAIAFINEKAKVVSGSMRDDLQKRVKFALTTSIKNGESTREAMDRVDEAYDKYVTPAYLENVVRTNTTEAINQGRLVQMRQPGMALFIQGVQYSAILDSRTTDVCRHLDGKIFKLGDPNLDKLTPPNHFMCRSLLVPVQIDEQIPDDEWLSAAEAGEGLDLAGEGFA